MPAAARLLTNCRPAVFADDSGSAKPQAGAADGAEPDLAADDSSEKFGESSFSGTIKDTVGLVGVGGWGVGVG